MVQETLREKFEVELRNDFEDMIPELVDASMSVPDIHQQFPDFAEGEWEKTKLKCTGRDASRCYARTRSTSRKRNPNRPATPDAPGRCIAAAAHMSDQ